MSKEILNTKQLAERLGVTKEYLRALRSSGKGPKFFKMGSAYSQARYRLEDVKEWEQSKVVDKLNATQKGDENDVSDTEND